MRYMRWMRRRNSQVRDEGQVYPDTGDTGRKKEGRDYGMLYPFTYKKGTEKQSGMVTGKEGIRKEKAG